MALDSIDLIGAFALHHEASLPLDTVASFSIGVFMGLQVALDAPEFADRFLQDASDNISERAAVAASTFVQWVMNLRQEMRAEAPDAE